MWPQVTWLLKALIGKTFSPKFNKMVHFVSLWISLTVLYLHWCLLWFRAFQRSMELLGKTVFLPAHSCHETHWWLEQPEPLKCHWIQRQRHLNIADEKNGKKRLGVGERLNFRSQDVEMRTYKGKDCRDCFLCLLMRLTVKWTSCLIITELQPYIVNQLPGDSFICELHMSSNN